MYCTCNDSGKAARDARVLVVGLAYKPDVDDTRESPSYELIERLREMGALVDYHDPHVPVAEPVRKHDLGMRSVDLDAESIRSYDCVLISTNHSTVDYAMIASEARLVVDTRDAMRPWAHQMAGRLVRA